jgi:aryl-alcohol dehydrogenase-like predicted oxidoreductase
VERLKENLGAAEVDLSAGDLQMIDNAMAAVEVQGERYPENLQRMVNL